jgi:hypothetical protein
MPTLRSVHRFFHKLVLPMLAGLGAILYRAGQEIGWIPKDVVVFPFLALLAWVLFLYWFFAGPRAVRLYSKAYRKWAKERRSMAYGLAILTGSVIGGGTGAAWWKLFEVHRKQMAKLKEAPLPANSEPHDAAREASADVPKKSPTPPSAPSAAEQEESKRKHLLEQARDFIVKLRDFGKDWEAKYNAQNDAYFSQLKSARTEEEKRQALERMDFHKKALMSDYQDTWEFTYQKDAIKLHDELLEHAPLGSDDELRVRATYMAPPKSVNWDRVMDVASDLDRLAGFFEAEVKRLPAPQVQGIGNLKARSLSFCKEMSKGIAERREYIQKEMPESPEKPKMMARSLSSWFRWKYMAQLKAFHDEFAQLHIRNDDLDRVLQIDADMSGIGQEYTLGPYELQTFEDSLAAMANQLKD